MTGLTSMALPLSVDVTWYNLWGRRLAVVGMESEVITIVRWSISDLQKAACLEKPFITLSWLPAFVTQNSDIIRVSHIYLFVVILASYSVSELPCSAGHIWQGLLWNQQINNVCGFFPPQDYKKAVLEAPDDSGIPNHGLKIKGGLEWWPSFTSGQADLQWESLSWLLLVAKNKESASDGSFGR